MMNPTEEDRAPFTKADFAGLVLQPKREVSIPVYSDEVGYLHVEYSQWSIDVVAETRAKLLAEVRRELMVVWREYAVADDEKLSPAAQVLRGQLLADLEIKEWL